MKPAPFIWHGPTSVDEAVSVLAECGRDGKVLAGGQSLVPVLAMRLASPAHLVDINRIAGLNFVESTPAGVTVGALARHRALERDAAATTAQPLLAQALAFVAHPTIRNRGTSVGSLAHADPAGELTCVLALTGGHILARSSRGERRIAAADFFLGPLESALAADELALHAFFPALPAGAGSAFTEVARRHGDYALCGVAAVVTVDAAGVVTEARCGYLVVAETPLVLEVTEAALTGEDALADLAMAAVDPQSDIHGSADYRRHLAGVLTVRAVRQATVHARARRQIVAA